ncbi:MAG: glycosyltransferase family 4 protein [Anaerolineae bacterium]
MLSKALVVGAYQRKAELIAAEPDIDLTVVAPSRWRDGDRVQRLTATHVEGYRLIEAPIALPGNFHLHAYPRLGRVLDQARPDLVHIDEEPYNLATRLALAAARRRGARTVFFTWQNLDRRYPPPFSWFEQAAYRQSDGAIAGSSTAADVLRAKGYRGPLWTVPQFGVDETEFAPAGAPRADGKPFTIGFAGRLTHGKGVDLLVEAFARTSASLGRASGAKLVLLGDGPERSALLDQAHRLGVAGQVELRTWLESSEMPRFYRQLDAFVLPSRSTGSWVEQFGRVLIEAMACGVPCVGSTSGEIPYVLGEAGLRFREGDSGDLRDQLRRLAADASLRAELSRAGRQRVLERYTMARVAADTAAVYRTVAA